MTTHMTRMGRVDRTLDPRGVPRIVGRRAAVTIVRFASLTLVAASAILGGTRLGAVRERWHRPFRKS